MMMMMVIAGSDIYKTFKCCNSSAIALRGLYDGQPPAVPTRSRMSLYLVYWENNFSKFDIILTGIFEDNLLLQRFYFNLLAAVLRRLSSWKRYRRARTRYSTLRYPGVLIKFADTRSQCTRTSFQGQTPKGGRGCLMSPPCLESQGCHLIPLCYLLSCSSA